MIDFPADSHGSGVFATTRWTLVAASAETQEPGSREALAQLCRTYWKPLYCYVQHRVRDPIAAQDLVQEFFLHLLEHKLIARADPERGRFRSYLLTCLQNFLRSDRRRAQAQKRGGAVAFVSYEQAFGVAAEEHITPEESYDAAWAAELFDRALARLRAEAAARGRERIFLELQGALAGEAEPLAVLAERVGLLLPTLKTALNRMRTRFREVLREEVVNTVGSDDEVDDELRHLLSLLARRAPVADAAS
ncbi:MAG: sigma-70 family RNA polymerase sigma factor [Verrucomicrobia bacterium]|nr:sigma-70 family RNA polymerase sigma factor [Verrucomicrobiota bacterium]